LTTVKNARPSRKTFCHPPPSNVPETATPPPKRSCLPPLWIVASPAMPPLSSCDPPLPTVVSSASFPSVRS
jgi:hypothetical protein